jgi:hypothetical protein
MSWLTQLYVFPVGFSWSNQLATFADHVPTELGSILGTVDMLKVNSDSDTEEFTALTIEQVRELHLEAQMSPIQHNNRIVVLGSIDTASLPAQQALLKMTEEPPRHVQIILTCTQKESVLPTLLSRCQIIEIKTQNAVAADLPGQIETFLHNYPDGKLSLTEAFAVSEIYKERPEAITFVEQLLHRIHNHSAYPNPHFLKIVQLGIVTLRRLRANVNTRLALEDFLFTFELSRQTQQNRL